MCLNSQVNYRSSSSLSNTPARPLPFLHLVVCEYCEEPVLLSVSTEHWSSQVETTRRHHSQVQLLLSVEVQPAERRHVTQLRQRVLGGSGTRGPFFRVLVHSFFAYTVILKQLTTILENKSVNDFF